MPPVLFTVQPCRCNQNTHRLASTHTGESAASEMAGGVNLQKYACHHTATSWALQSQGYSCMMHDGVHHTMTEGSSSSTAARPAAKFRRAERMSQHLHFAFPHHEEREAAADRRVRGASSRSRCSPHLRRRLQQPVEHQQLTRPVVLGTHA